jgi:hypothetical protein
VSRQAEAAGVGFVLGNAFEIHNAYMFLIPSTALVAYLLYTMIRKRKGERPGHQGGEPEL